MGAKWIKTNSVRINQFRSNDSAPENQVKTEWMGFLSQNFFYPVWPFSGKETLFNSVMCLGPFERLTRFKIKCWPPPSASDELLTLWSVFKEMNFVRLVSSSVSQSPLLPNFANQMDVAAGKCQVLVMFYLPTLQYHFIRCSSSGLLIPDIKRTALRCLTGS